VSVGPARLVASHRNREARASLSRGATQSSNEFAEVGSAERDDYTESIRPGWWNGIHDRLKTGWASARAGSNPAPGTYHVSFARRGSGGRGAGGRRHDNGPRRLVREEIAKIAGYWLELGVVDAFHVDAVPFLFETGGIAGEVNLDPHDTLRDPGGMIKDALSHLPQMTAGGSYRTTSQRERLSTRHVGDVLCGMRPTRSVE
jgi:glycosidase